MEKKIVILTQDLLDSKDLDTIAAAITGHEADVASDLVTIIETNSIEVATLNDQLATYTAKLEEIRKSNDQLAADKASIQQDLDDTTTLNEKLQAQLDKPVSNTQVNINDKQTSWRDKTFSLDGIQYAFVLPSVFHKGVNITPVEVCADTKLQQQLVKMKSGMIKVIA